MTSTIRIGAAHDLLALVPALAGHRPSRSLVCLAFRGSRVIGALRYDLPTTARARDQLADAALGVLCRLFDVDGMAAIVYTDHRYRSRAAAGECALLGELVRRARRAGFAVHESLRVAADAWGSLLDAETPAGGRSLTEIESSPFRGHPAVRDAVSRAADAYAELPEVHAAEIEAIQAEITDQAHEAGPVHDPVATVESLLRDPPGAEPSPDDVERLARLIRSADVPVCQDAIMLQIAFGRALGELTLEHGRATAESAAAAGLTVAEYVQRMHRVGVDASRTAGQGADEPGADERGAGQPGVGQRGAGQPGADTHGPAATRADDPVVRVALARLLMGEAGQRPDVGRVERGLEILKRAAVSADGGPRASLLCMSAWLAWSLGRGSAAWTLVMAALMADEDHGMGRFLAQHLAAGELPEWTLRGPDAQTSCPESVQ